MRFSSYFLILLLKLVIFDRDVTRELLSSLAPLGWSPFLRVLFRAMARVLPYSLWSINHLLSILLLCFVLASWGALDSSKYFWIL